LRHGALVFVSKLSFWIDHGNNGISEAEFRKIWSIRLEFCLILQKLDLDWHSESPSECLSDHQIGNEIWSHRKSHDCSITKVRLLPLERCEDLR
jgi:hypothetical protein